MENENTDTSQVQDNTPDAAVNNTDAQPQSSGDAGQQASADAQNAHTPKPKEKTFTQAEVNQMIANRLPKAVKAELKKLAGDGEDAPNVQELQQRLKDYETRTRTFEAKEAVRDFLVDSRNKLRVPSESLRLVEKLVIQEIAFDDDGNITNLQEAVERVKSEAPQLFTPATPNINGYAGNKQPSVVDMNTLIRQTAGRG